MNEDQQNESNLDEQPMNFNPNNPFYTQLFRYRYDTLTSEREKERDSLMNTRSSNFLISHYPPYGMFRAADELTKEKIVYNEFDNLNQPSYPNEPDSLNIIRLAQTTDILNSVLKETQEIYQKVDSSNTQFIKFQKKQ